MPPKDVRLAMADMRDCVRRDAGVEDHGYTGAVDVRDDVVALKRLLRCMLAGDPQNAIRTRKPKEWDRP